MKLYLTIQNKIKQVTKKFVKDERGISILEAAAILALVGTVLAIVFPEMRDAIVTKVRALISTATSF